MMIEELSGWLSLGVSISGIAGVIWAHKRSALILEQRYQADADTNTKDHLAISNRITDLRTETHLSKEAIHNRIDRQELNRAADHDLLVGIKIQLDLLQKTFDRYLDQKPDL